MTAHPLTAPLLAFCALTIVSISGFAANPDSTPPVLSGKRAGNADASSPEANHGDRKANASHYWYDGERRRALTIDPARIADFDGATGALSQGGSQIAIIRTAAETKATASDGGKTSPVFVDSGSGQMTGALPGGILVTTREPVDASAAASLAESFGSQVSRAIGDSGTLWLFAAETGIPSLTLANRIHESGRVASASPDWWMPRQLK